MRFLFLAATAVLGSGIGGCQPSSPKLPPHVVASNSSLAPKRGRRIEIHSQNAALTKPECRALIEKYRSAAAPDGQISVRKPSKMLGNQMTAWCFDNFDGEGIQFNDALFD